MPTILMCDDDVHILRVAEIKLTKSGFQVTGVGDGQQAWELLQRESFDALITDRQMPRLDGVELVRRVRAADDARLRSLPIVLLTSRGHDLPEDCRVELLVDKPFSPRTLVQQLESLLAAENSAS